MTGENVKTFSPVIISTTIPRNIAVHVVDHFNKLSPILVNVHSI